MKKKLKVLHAALCSLSALLFFFAAASVVAGEVENRIKALEEIQRANAEELARLKNEQIELKKEATAAAVALPEFVYRPGRGLNITAADQSWGLGFDYEFNMDMTWLAGEDARRNGDFELFGRRNRPSIYYYRDRGFYEFTFRMDCDAGDCGVDGGLLQRSAMFMHFEKLNRWFPTLQFGMDTPATVNSYDRGSSATAPTLEHTLLRRDSGIGGGGVGAHTGISLIWQNLPVGVTPGTWQFHYYWAINSFTRGDGLSDQSSKMDHGVYLDLQPFSQSKDKWLAGLAFNLGAFFMNVDDRNNSNATRRLRLRTQLGPNNITLWDTGNNFGSGMNTYITPGLQYRIGPYTIKGSSAFWRQQDSADQNSGPIGRVQATNWKIVNELFLWSPKGFLTGSVTQPNSVLAGWSFERNDADCGATDCAVGGQFRRNRILVREAGIVYYFRPGINILLGTRWYDASNVPTNAQVALGCSRNNALSPGKSCDWVDTALRFRFYF